MKGLSQPFTDHNGLCGMFQQNYISSNQRRCHGIYRRHKGIIPRRDDQHRPMRHAFYISLKFIAIFDSDGCQTARCNICHKARTLLKTTKFTTVTDRPPHLPCQFWHNIIILLPNNIYCRLHQIYAFRKWSRRPMSLSRMRLSHSLSCRLQR